MQHREDGALLWVCDIFKERSVLMNDITLVHISRGKHKVSVETLYAGKRGIKEQ